MNTTLEAEREEEQLLFCFDRADPIATIRLHRRISLSHSHHFFLLIIRSFHHKIGMWCSFLMQVYSMYVRIVSNQSL